jgi:N-acetylmuramoyl-L-alanine amidase
MFKKVTLLLFCLVIVFSAFLPQREGIASQGTVLISSDTVNVREGPSLSYPLIKQVNKGEKYNIIKEKEDWTQIELSYGKTGWVANWLTTKEGTKSPVPSTDDEVSSGIANTDQLRVRSGPGTSFRIIGFLQKGQAVTILDQNENWLKVSAAFGEGWVSNQYIDSVTSQETNTQANNGSGQTTKGVVTGDILNVRTKPSANGGLLGKLSKGSNVTVYSTQNNWYEIQYSNQMAWVSADYVTLQGNTQNDSSSTDSKKVIGTVTASTLSVRSSSSLNADVIGTVSMGQKFSILAEDNNWVKIEYKPGKYGWTAGWYLEKDSSASSSDQKIKNSTITILQDGSNIRKQPSLTSDVIERAKAGETFDVSKLENNWYEIKLKNGSVGYIAGWVVSVNGTSSPIEKAGAENYLKNKTIVIDPGHGGEDNGTTGYNGTHEKDLTLRTAKLLYDKLSAAGANVYLTRSNDTYISLPLRVSYAESLHADAFVSIHYDSNSDNSSVRGSTGYYYHDYQKALADEVYSSTINQTGLKNRGIRFGDFHVLRENSQKATLLELGYLSNPTEEMTLNSGQFQENAATGIYNGLARFFKDNK